MGQGELDNLIRLMDITAEVTPQATKDELFGNPIFVLSNLGENNYVNI